MPLLGAGSGRSRRAVGDPVAFGRLLRATSTGASAPLMGDEPALLRAFHSPDSLPPPLTGRRPSPTPAHDCFFASLLMSGSPALRALSPAPTPQSLRDSLISWAATHPDHLFLRENPDLRTVGHLLTASSLASTLGPDGNHARYLSHHRAPGTPSDIGILALAATYLNAPISVATSNGIIVQVVTISPDYPAHDPVTIAHVTVPNSTIGHYLALPPPVSAPFTSLTARPRARALPPPAPSDLTPEMPPTPIPNGPATTQLAPTATPPALPPSAAPGPPPDPQPQPTLATHPPPPWNPPPSAPPPPRLSRPSPT